MKVVSSLLFVLALFFSELCFGAEEVFDLSIVIKDHKFVPAEITAPAGKKIKLKVINEGPGSEEFESNELNLEKIIPPGRTSTLTFGPLKQGEYKFFGEFHLKTCQGKLIVKPNQ